MLGKNVFGKKVLVKTSEEIMTLLVFHYGSAVKLRAAGRVVMVVMFVRPSD